MNEYTDLIKENLDTLLTEMDKCSYLFSENPEKRLELYCMDKRYKK